MQAGVADGSEDGLSHSIPTPSISTQMGRQVRGAEVRGQRSEGLWTRLLWRVSWKAAGSCWLYCELWQPFLPCQCPDILKTLGVKITPPPSQVLLQPVVSRLSLQLWIVNAPQSHFSHHVYYNGGFCCLCPLVPFPSSSFESSPHG